MDFLDGLVDIFDDGSSVVRDSAGNPVSIVSQGGTVQPAPGAAGSSIVQQFAELFNYGARGLIDTALAREAAPGQAQAAAAGAPATGVSSAQLVKYAMLAGAALLLYKLAVR